MKPRILIIDDEKETRDLFKSFLEEDDYEIHEAENGQEAFNLVSSEIFDLYITDVFMPEMNGIEFLKILKTFDPDAVVVIITGYDKMEYTKQALEYGAFRFLTKPVKMAEFRSIVELGLLERRKLFQSTTAEKLLRMKQKLNTNVELRERVFRKFQEFLITMEEMKPSYIEIGGAGSQGKIWGKFYSAFKPMPIDGFFSQDEINIMILSILSNSQLETLVDQKSIKANFEFTVSDVTYRYRLTIYFDMDELVIGVKTTRRSLISLEEMKFSNLVLNRLSFKNENEGLVIIAGPPGSGKSSLIDAIVNHNNTHYSGSIFLINDSLEYYHESKNSVIRYQKVYRDVNSVTDALDRCLDYHPNMVVIEDITSPELLDGALKLVDTGSLVFATMKNKSVTDVIYKLLALYPADSRDLIRRHLARTLAAVICVQLLPTTNEKMVSVKEILVANEQISQIIYSGNIEELYPIMQRNRKIGLQTMEQDLLGYIKTGQIAVEIAMEAANRAKLLKDLMQYASS